MKPFRHIPAMAISVALIFTYSERAYCQATQNSPSSPAQIQKVKDKVQKIGSGGDVTVTLFSGLEY